MSLEERCQALNPIEDSVAELRMKAGLEEDKEQFLAQVRQERACLDIFVMGQIKDGKSTFLNALLVPKEGYELPMGADPLTMKPWRLLYANEPSPMVRAVSKQNKKVWEWPWSEIKAVQNIDALWSEVKEFQASLSSTLLGSLEETVFWDTPGFNDPSQREDGVPRNQESELITEISMSEVVILICRRTTYKSLDTVLRELSKTPIRRFVAVLNLKTPEEHEKREDYKQEIENHLEGLFQRKVQVFPVNCKKAYFGQRELLAIAHDLRSAVESFQGNSDIQQLTGRDWAEDLKGLVQNIKVSGIAPLRAELKKMLEDRETLVLDRAILRLREPLKESRKKFADLRKTCDRELGDLQKKLEKMTAALSDRELRADVRENIEEKIREYAASQKGKWLAESVREALQQAWRKSYPYFPIWFSLGLNRAYAEQKEMLKDCLSKTLRAEIIPQLDREVTDFFAPFMADRLHTLIRELVSEHALLAEEAGVTLNKPIDHDYEGSLSIKPEVLPPPGEEPFNKISDILTDEIKDAAIMAQREGSRPKDADEYLVERIADCLVEWWRQRAIDTYAESMKESVDSFFLRACGRLEQEATKRSQPLLAIRTEIENHKEELARLEDLLTKAEEVRDHLDALTTKETNP